MRAAAQRSGRGLSGWLAEAAAAHLRAETSAEFLDAWETEHGELTAGELARATAEMGPSPGRCGTCRRNALGPDGGAHSHKPLGSSLQRSRFAACEQLRHLGFEDPAEGTAAVATVEHGNFELT